MAITKMLHMGASKKKQIDIHLKQAIEYVLNPTKLGEANLAGGINCPLAIAYEQMKATKEFFQKTGGRQGYHIILSLPPGEGSPEEMYEIGMKFADRFLKNEYEAIVAVHTDKDHLHAHILINSVNLATGYKFQYHNGDWKHILQPITNELCEEYGFEIMPAEYSEDPKNMARPDWEVEKSYSKLIKEDVHYCAMLAEDEQHFLYLLKRLGYEAKDGAHIALKAPGMKRYKRIDTISDEFSRANLQALIKYTDKTMANPKVNTMNPTYVKRAKLSPFQKKYYARLYRLRLIEKKRFNYKSANYHQAIRKMQELQEEYLLVVNYDVNSIMDLLELRERLLKVEETIKEQQKELYAKRGALKRNCKTPEDFEQYRQSEESYRNSLEKLKDEKNSIKQKLKIATRCADQFGSKIEFELENAIPVGEMDDIENIYDVEVPENPYREEVIEEEVVEDPEVVISEGADFINIGDEDNVVKHLELPDNMKEYLKLSFDEKVARYQFDGMDKDKTFEYVSKYLRFIGMKLTFDEEYEEYDTLMKCYENQKEIGVIENAVEEVLQRMDTLGMEPDYFDKYDVSMKAMVFDFEDMEYYAGIKVYRGVLERIGIHKGVEEIYDDYARIYEECAKRNMKMEENSKKR